MKRAVGWLGLVVLPVALAQAPASPFAIKQFSATMQMAAGPAGGMAMKIYKSGEHYRTDMPAGGYMVMDLTTHKSFMVMPTGMCMEMPGQMGAGRGPNPFATRGTVTVEPLGSDTIDGHACRVERVTVTAPGEAAHVMKVWSATDLKGFPLRVETESNGRTVQINYKDVSLAAPDAKLFVQPANCRTMPGMPGR